MQAKPKPDRPRRRLIKQPKDRSIRICTRCLETKPIADFAKNSGKCRPCRKARGAEYYMYYKTLGKDPQPQPRKAP